ncbi:MAG: UDP-3-O-(3-hydroxymyristoyl)glucosamine N-acyltransferase [Bdellovibrionia bacterium]
MSHTAAELLKQFSPLIESILGDGSVSISQVSPLERIRPGSLVFATHPDQLEQALKSEALIVVTKTGMVTLERTNGKTVLLTKRVNLAHAKIVHFIHGRQPTKTTGIHPTAIIALSAKIGKGTGIGPYCIIGENVVIGEGGSIGPHCIIAENARIGDRSVFWGQLYVGARCEIGNDCVIHPQVSIGPEGFGFAADDANNQHKIPQIGTVIIEDRVDIGSMSTIDRATFGETRIGAGSKLDTHVHIAHNCSIGKNCLLTAGLNMAGSSHMGDNCMTGGNVTITDHIRIGNNIHFGGLSGVAKTVEKSGAYGGYPLQPMKDYLKTTATMVHLVEMRKNIHAIMKKLDLK